MRSMLTAVTCTLILAACGGDQAATSDSATAGPVDSPAASDQGVVTADIVDSAGRDLGILTLTDDAGGIAVRGTLSGIAPGEHAIHVHTTGSCEAPAFTSAGGHWNPTARKHGSENAEGPHFGDMVNITVAADSTVTVDVRTPGGTLRGTDALLDADGAAVVVHATADDYRTDPAGDAGSRIACGVVTAR